MCDQCYREFGSPTIDNDRVRQAAAAIAKVYEYSCVGGNLHVFIDDWNIGWDSPEEAAQEMEELIAWNVHEAGPDQLATERRCAALLAALSEAEQASALGLNNGFWDHNGSV